MPNPENHVLTQAVLDGIVLLPCPECGVSHSEELVLLCSEHPDAGVSVEYVKATGVLTLRCCECGEEAGAVKVAPT